MSTQRRWSLLRPTAPVGAIGVTAFFLSAAVAIPLGQLENFLWWTIGIATVLTVVISQSTIAPDIPENSRWRWILFHVVTASSVAIAIASAVTIGTILAIAIGGRVADLSLGVLNLVRQSSGKGWQMLVAALLTAAAGALFFVFRLRLRLLYGATEALVGAAIAAQRVGSEPGEGLPSETGFYIAILTAGVYLVVRGLDNMHQAMKSDDPVWMWAWGRWAALRRLTGTPASYEVQIGDVVRANSTSDSVREERGFGK